MVDGQGKHGEAILVGQEETGQVEAVGYEEDRYELTTLGCVRPSEAKG